MEGEGEDVSGRGSQLRELRIKCVSLFAFVAVRPCLAQDTCDEPIITPPTKETDPGPTGVRTPTFVFRIDCEVDIAIETRSTRAARRERAHTLGGPVALEEDVVEGDGAIATCIL